MQKTIKKRALSILTALSICVSVLSVTAPASLAFSDISSENVEEAVTVLSSLGIISGYSDGTFQPNKTLTRAEFAKLAIYAEGHEDQTSSNAYRSLFNDISSSHWALKYINLAYSEGLVSGYADGTFGPDDNVTCAQAVTIVLRLLGYTTSDIGTFWPQDYMSKAENLGLLDDIDAEADDELTRGEAALIFYAMIQQTAATGEDYINTLVSSTVSSALLLDNDAEADDGSTGYALVYVNGSLTYYEQENQLDDSFVEQRGTLLFNKSGDVIGFLPDAAETVSVTISVAETTESKIIDQSENKYTISSDTSVILDGELTTYAKCYDEIASLGNVKLYYSTSGGTVDLIVASVQDSASIAVANCESKFSSFFENKLDIPSESYTIYKDGLVADKSDLERFDVAVYNDATDCLLVSSVKVTGFIENASPNIESATSITMLGTTFSVLETAQSYLEKFDIGDVVTLLLAPDGQVAAALDPDTISASMVGILNSTSSDSDSNTVASVSLLNGTEVTATLQSSETVDDLIGTLVTLTTVSDGKYYVKTIGTSKVRENLDVVDGLLGSTELSQDVKIYDQAGNGAVVSVDLDDILVETVNASDIKYFSTNSAGKINLILLDDVTGNCYTYGFLTLGSKSTGTYSSNQTVSIEYGTGLYTDTYVNNLYLTEGIVAGLAGAADGTSQLKYLTGVNVTKSAFSDDAIEIAGVLVSISENVVVYNASTESWTTLSEAKRFTDSFTVYYDKTPKTGGQIRVIVAN